MHAETIEEYPFSTNPAIDFDLPEWNNPKNLFASYLVYLAKSDADLRGLLLLAGLITSSTAIECILTWGTLYKILDSVKRYSISNGFDINNFADMSVVNQFTAASARSAARTRPARQVPKANGLR